MMAQIVASELILAHLKAIQSRLSAIEGRLQSLETDMCSLKGHMVSFRQTAGIERVSFARPFTSCVSG